MSRLIHHLDDHDLSSFMNVSKSFDPNRFGYVVTPNVDHLIRWHDDSNFRALYEDASYVLLDSRFLAYLLRFFGRNPPRVCTGSDLTAQLFHEIINPDDRIVLIGGDDAQASKLRHRFGLRNLQHFNPPMGFIRSTEQVEECLRFVEANSPFRFCLLAVGSPQQETIAQMLKRRGRARGLALCIGASINFLTGTERRAPRWIQRGGLEWAYRLSRDPSRLAKRYLLRGPRMFTLLHRFEFRVRPATDRR